MSVAFAAVYAVRLGRLADPRTAVYRRGHGRRPPPPGQVVTAVEPARRGTVRRGQRPGLLPPAQRLGRGQGGQRLVGAPDLDRTAGGAEPDRRPDPRPPAPADAVGLRLRAARPGRRLRGTRRRSRRSRRPSATACRRPPAGSPTSGSTPRSRPTGRSTPTARCDAALASRRLATGGADPAERDPDHRPARRRGRAVGRPPQEVAPVRQQGADRRDRGRRRGRRPPRRVLPDLPRDGRPGRLPDPRRVGLPRRLGGVRADAATPGCCSPRPPTASRWPRSSSSAAGRGSSSRTAG